MVFSQGVPQKHVSSSERPHSTALLVLRTKQGAREKGRSGLGNLRRRPGITGAFTRGDPCFTALVWAFFEVLRRAHSWFSKHSPGLAVLMLAAGEANAE